MGPTLLTTTVDTLGRRRLLAGGVAGLLMLGSSSCGYVLYPGRRGRSGGTIDIPVLIIDLLWLLPGLVPGLICLIVDFTSGCIYGGGGGGASRSPRPGQSDPRVATVEVEVDGEVVASGQVEPAGKTQLRWSRVVDEATLREKARVVVRTGDGALAQAHVRELL